MTPTKKKQICRLCKKAEVTSKHHLIPKNVVRKINPNSDVKNLIIYLCNDCHKAIHLALYEHIIVTSQIGVDVDRFAALRYKILKDFLKKKYPEAQKEWGAHFLEFIKSSLDEYNNSEGGQEDE